MKQCLIITDDKIGNINPASGLGDALGQKMPLNIQHKIISYSLYLDFIPLFFIKYIAHIIPFLLRPNFDKSFFASEYFPHIIIGNGHASIMVCALLRIYARFYKKSCFFIQLQNPRISPHYFDVVIPPYHDKVTGENIISTTGSLNHITQEKIKSAVIPPFIQGLSVPVISVFIGGRNKKYKFTDADAQKFAYNLKEFMTYNQCALWITASRRTSEKQYQLIQNILSGENVFFWNGTGDNPYFSMLKISKMAIVTCDSVNMLCEIATAGVKILLYPLAGKAGKFEHLYHDLKRRKLLQEFSLSPKKTTASILNETVRIVKKLVPKINKFFTNEKK